MGHQMLFADVAGTVKVQRENAGAQGAGSLSGHTERIHRNISNVVYFTGRCRGITSSVAIGADIDRDNKVIPALRRGLPGKQDSWTTWPPQ